MFKVVILNVYDPKAKMPDTEMILRDDFETSSQAELRGLRWLISRPNDIVMLLEVEVGICQHCGVVIQEKEGWVRHRWIHEGGYYACLPDGKTQAEPA